MEKFIFFIFINGKIQIYYFYFVFFIVIIIFQENLN